MSTEDKMIKQFEFEGRDIRTLEQDGEIWFVMTPLVKTSGFLGNGAFPVRAHRPHPGLESTRQDVPGGVLVSMQGQATSLADVLADGQCFVHIFTARATQFAGTPRIHCHHCDTGACSFVSQDRQKAAPGGIGDCAAEPMVPEHIGNAQAFHRDQAVATDQVQSDFMMMIAPLVGDVSMKNLDFFNGLAAICSAFFLTGNRTLGSAKRGQRLFEEARVCDDLASRGGKEVFNSHINTDGGKVALWNSKIAQVTGQDHEPLISFPCERCCFDGATNGAVIFASDRADVLHAQAVVVQSDAVAVGGKFDAVEVIAAFEAGIAGFASGFDTQEEGSKGLIETAHGRLSGGVVEAGEVGIIPAQVLELGRLVKVSNGVFMQAIGIPPLFQTEVVKPPMRFEHDAQFAFLVGISEETKFVATKHCNVVHLGNLLSTKKQERRAAIPLSAKADSSLAAC